VVRHVEGGGGGRRRRGKGRERERDEGGIEGRKGEARRKKSRPRVLEEAKA